MAAPRVFVGSKVIHVFGPAILPKARNCPFAHGDAVAIADLSQKQLQMAMCRNCVQQPPPTQAATMSAQAYAIRAADVLREDRGIGATTTMMQRSPAALSREPTPFSAATLATPFSAAAAGGGGHNSRRSPSPPPAAVPSSAAARAAAVRAAEAENKKVFYGIDDAGAKVHTDRACRHIAGKAVVEYRGQPDDRSICQTCSKSRC